MNKITVTVLRTSSPGLQRDTRKLLLALCLSVFLLPSNAGAFPDLHQPDKKTHFVYCAGLTLGAYLYLRDKTSTKLEALAYSNALCLLASIAKEATDKKFEGDDITAGGLGALSISLPIILMDF